MRLTARWGAAGLLAAAATTFLMLAGSPSQAAPTCTTTFTGSGDWSTAANWSTNARCRRAATTRASHGEERRPQRRIHRRRHHVEGTLSGAGTLTITDTGAADPSELDGDIAGTAVNVTAGAFQFETAQFAGGSS